MTYPSATLKPATADLVVRDPITRLPLSVDGEDKLLDSYWSRRLVDGDVLIVTAAAPQPKPAAKAVLKPV